MTNTAPSADNLLLGKGHLLARKYLSGGGFGPWQHLGNVTELVSASEDTRLDKYSAMTAEASLYASRLQRRKITATATAEEFTEFNLSMLLMAESATTAAQAATAVTDELLSAAVPAATLGAALGGHVFFTAKYGPHTNIVVKLGAATLALGTDYQILFNRKGQAAIQILAGSTAVTNATDDLTIDYDPPAYTAGLTVLRAGKETTIEVQLRFIGDPSSGPAMQADIWKANINPQGGLGFISEEYANFQLAFEILDDSVNHPNSPLWEVLLTDG